MAAVIELTSASSNMTGYLAGWLSGFTPNYGDFNPTYDPTNPNQVYTQWGFGSSGGNGVYMDGEMQYTQGDLQGTVDTVYIGTGFSTSSGFSLGTVGLSFTPDQNDPVASFDYAIYDFSVNGSTTGLYAYFADVGTEIHGTSASDILTGFGGEDVFVFDANSGNDTVQNFESGDDLLDVSAWGATDIGDLTVSTFAGDTYVIYGVESIALEDVTSVSSSDFLFA